MTNNHPKSSTGAPPSSTCSLLGLTAACRRKELATELGCPADKMGDSAQMNLWLHKAVLRRLAENGGNVPADLLD